MTRKQLENKAWKMTHRDYRLQLGNDKCVLVFPGVLKALSEMTSTELKEIARAK